MDVVSHFMTRTELGERLFVFVVSRTAVDVYVDVVVADRDADFDVERRLCMGAQLAADERLDVVPCLYGRF